MARICTCTPHAPHHAPMHGAAAHADAAACGVAVASAPHHTTRQQDPHPHPAARTHLPGVLEHKGIGEVPGFVQHHRQVAEGGAPVDADGRPDVALDVWGGEG